MSRNSIEPRVQKLRGKDGNLLDEDKIRRADDRRTIEVEVRKFDAATARRQISLEYALTIIVNTSRSLD